MYMYTFIQPAWAKGKQFLEVCTDNVYNILCTDIILLLFICIPYLSLDKGSVIEVPCVCGPLEG